MDDNADLLARIVALEEWQKQRTAQQISYPLDIQSQNILGQYFMHIDSLINYEIVGAASHTTSTFIGNQGNLDFQLSPQVIFPYTVNVANNTLTSTTNFNNDTQVILNATVAGAFPTPLAINTVYFVVSSTGSTFKLSATSGGSAIDITDTGTGPQYISMNLF